MKVLVGYATVHGSTAEVAERIGHVLTQRGHDVTVANVKTLTHLDGFQAFVLGTAIEAGTWLPEFKAFFEKRMSPSFERPVNQAIETIQWQAAWKTRDLEAIKRYLKP